jgi:cyanophycin synthetase
VEGCDLVHPDNIALTERVAEALRIDILGIDIITPDLGNSFLDGGLTILEVNHSPGISGFFDDEGAYIDTAMMAVELLNPLLDEEYVPVVAVQEHSMAAAVTSGIGSVLDAAGYSPGVVNKSGMQVGGSPWAVPDSLDYRDPAFTVLRNSRIDAAVIERSSQQILDYGLGSGGCDISVVLDSSSDSIVTELWPTGVKVSEATKLLITSCRRACVALVDDPLIDLAAEDIPATKLYAMSLKGWTDAIEKHVASGATALALENVSETGLSVRISRGGAEATAETLDISMPLPDRSESGLMPSLTALAVLVSMGYTTEEAARFLRAVAQGGVG